MGHTRFWRTLLRHLQPTGTRLGTPLRKRDQQKLRACLVRSALCATLNRLFKIKMEPKLMKPIMLGLFLDLVLISFFHAQTSATTPTSVSVAVAPASQSGQAPDERTRKISELPLCTRARPTLRS